MPAKVQHPFHQPKPSILRSFCKPFVWSSLSASALALWPSTGLGAWESALNEIPGGEAGHRSVLAITGFILGYGIYQLGDWLRLKLLKRMLAYQGWIAHPKSTRTTLWSLATRLLRGGRPFSTFQFQSLLPKQPLPDLDATLDKWLSVSHMLLKQEDYEMTKEVVEDFRKNEGPTLQKFLQNKATKEDSWIHDYWLNGAYLSSRIPLAVYNNYIMGAAFENEAIDQLSRAATVTYLMATFEKMLSEENVSPVFIQDLIPLCMDGFKFLFNSNRVPGDYMDEIVRYPGHDHIIVIRKGRYYKMHLNHTSENGEKSLYTPSELRAQFEHIIQQADREENGKELAVAALTSQHRTTWAACKRKLMKNNAEAVRDIDTCMFVVSLEDKSPKDADEFMHFLLVGSGEDVWFDKCFTVLVYENNWTGCNVEHSALDAMIFVVLKEYVTLFEEYDNNGVVKTQHPRPLNTPTRIEWDVSDMKEDITKAVESHRLLANDIQTHSTTPAYGKGFMKKQGISPDGYIQMCMQLAYYRMHKRFPKTYEPSTARIFVLGRTETVHPGSEYSKDWVKAMDDESASNGSKIELLKKAVKQQTAFRLQATVGAGCDRHLMALLCASRELGMDFPKIFTDKPWQMPFTLSTSQAPNMFFEYGCHLDFNVCFGAFGPTDDNGYGVGYSIFGDDRINFQITCWNSGEGTNVIQLGQHIRQAFEDVKMLFKNRIN